MCESAADRNPMLFQIKQGFLHQPVIFSSFFTVTKCMAHMAHCLDLHTLISGSGDKKAFGKQHKVA